MIDLSPCGVPVFNSLKDVKREKKRKAHSNYFQSNGTATAPIYMCNHIFFFCEENCTSHMGA